MAIVVGLKLKLKKGGQVGVALRYSIGLEIGIRKMILIKDGQSAYDITKYLYFMILL